jgi:integrase
MRLVALLGDLPLAAVSTDDCQRFREARGREVAVNTVRRELKSVRAFFGWCVRLGLLERNPAAGVEIPRGRRNLPRWIDGETTARLLADLAGDDEADPDWLLMALLAVRQGMRRGEILGLRWEDVHLEDGLIEIRMSKSKDPRRLPLHGEVARVLGAREGERRGPVFLARYDGAGVGLSFDSPKRLNGWLRRKGYGVGLHGLRHSWATQLALAGASALDLRGWLGHSSLATTLLYVQATGHGAEGLIRGLGGRAGSPRGSARSGRKPGRRGGTPGPGRG